MINCHLLHHLFNLASQGYSWSIELWNKINCAKWNENNNKKSVNRNTVYKKASIKIKWQNAPKYNDMLDSISTFLSQCIYMPLLHVLKWVSSLSFSFYFLCAFVVSLYFSFVFSSSALIIPVKQLVTQSGS